MYQNFLTDTTFFHFLYKCDQQIAEEYCKKSCIYCNKGILHVANYQRKPKGVPKNVSSCFSKKFSFCCNVEGCRKRTTPPSMRFMGRKVYVGMVILLVFTLGERTSSKIDQLMVLTGVNLPEETLRRWQYWWGKLPFTDIWKQYGLGAMIKPKKLPLSLLECFEGSAREKLIHLLFFLSPLTTNSHILNINIMQY
jgi:hypothetical protein